MPKLRANPSLTGGQIRLRKPGRAANLKWLGVFAVMVAATAIEGGLPVSQFGRAAVEFAWRGGSTVAVASQADIVDRGSFRMASLSNDVAVTGSVVGAADDTSNTETSDFVAHYSAAAAGLMAKTPLKAAFCPWAKPRINT